MAALQITLGMLVILSYVNIVIALLHQANAILLFVLAIYFIHRFRALDAAYQVQDDRLDMIQVKAHTD